jgi:hypothetical protein
MHGLCAWFNTTYGHDVPSLSHPIPTFATIHRSSPLFARARLFLVQSGARGRIAESVRLKVTQPRRRLSISGRLFLLTPVSVGNSGSVSVDKPGVGYV